MDRTAIDWARQTALATPEDLQPIALLFLLREYLAGGPESARGAIERGLTRGLVAARDEPDACRRLQWVRLLTESAALSDDERVRETVDRALAPAIDALESGVRRAYEPGEGLLDATCDQQLRYADALLVAFDLSGRLPYAMLAEELLRHARRHWWSTAHGMYEAGFAANCTALQVLCRLSALHADPEYRDAVLPAPDSFFTEDARRIAAGLGARSGEHPQEAGAFGAALLDWFALETDLQ